MGEDSITLMKGEYNYLPPFGGGDTLPERSVYYLPGTTKRKVSPL